MTRHDNEEITGQSLTGSRSEGLIKPLVPSPLKVNQMIGQTHDTFIELEDDADPSHDKKASGAIPFVSKQQSGQDYFVQSPNDRSSPSVTSLNHQMNTYGSKHYLKRQPLNTKVIHYSEVVQDLQQKKVMATSPSVKEIQLVNKDHNYPVKKQSP